MAFDFWTQETSLKRPYERCQWVLETSDGGSRGRIENVSPPFCLSMVKIVLGDINSSTRLNYITWPLQAPAGQARAYMGLVKSNLGSGAAVGVAMTTPWKLCPRRG